MFRYRFESPENPDLPVLPNNPESHTNLVSDIRSSLYTSTITTPYHSSLPIVYADFTATGQASEIVERKLRESVLPVFANTHSVSSACARFSTYFRIEARAVIANFLNAPSELYATIFTGSGATAAVAKFVALVSAFDHHDHLEVDRWHAFRCRLCDVRFNTENSFRRHLLTDTHLARSTAITAVSSVNDLADAVDGTTGASAPEVVKFQAIIDVFAHHSVLLPLREAAKVGSRFDAKISSFTSLTDLDARLAEAASRGLRPLVVVTVVSNITGERRDVHAISRLVHQYKGVVAWDAAAVAGHFRLDVNGPTGGSHADFVFLSPHKMVGGPGASGVLIARKQWLTTAATPTTPGGGTVFFVSAAGHSYIGNPEEREEAGTPNILADVKAGLVFILQSRLDSGAVFQAELAMRNRFLDAMATVKGFVPLLGSSEQAADMLEPCGIVSFVVRAPAGSRGEKGIYLHHNFVVALLNDIFGIQARGGCACAGPYAQDLLQMTAEEVAEFQECLETSGQDVFRPGFVRLGFHYTMTEVDRLVSAVKFVCERGAEFLSAYVVDVNTGEWKHKGFEFRSVRRWLSDLDTTCTAATTTCTTTATTTGLEIPSKDDWLKLGEAALAKIASGHQRTAVRAPLDAEWAKRLLWFATPGWEDVGRPLGMLTESRAPVLEIVELANDMTTNVASEVAVVGQTTESSDSVARRVKMTIPKSITSPVTTALKEFSMIRPNDRVLVGLSGGKDSLTLLHVLLNVKRRCGFPFTLAAATVDPMTPEYDPKDLGQYVRSLAVEHHLLREPIMAIAKEKMKNESICAFCARMKRGLLYGCMRREGYNVLALGQHMDDVVESFVMSCFRNGALRTMKANYVIDEGDLRVIRPLVYVRERETEKFSKSVQLPVVADNCPACFKEPKERRRVKLLLSEEEYDNEGLFGSILRAINPLLAGNDAAAGAKAVEESDDVRAELALTKCGADGVCEIPKK